MDPTWSESTRQAVAADPETLTRGYTTAESHTHRAEYDWVCPTCFGDFRGRCGWTLVTNDDAPLAGPEATE